MSNVPDGWRLVPVEPTEAMLAAGEMECDSIAWAGNTYRAMLAASPEQPQQQALGRAAYLAGRVRDYVATPEEAGEWFEIRDAIASGQTVCVRPQQQAADEAERKALAHAKSECIAAVKYVGVANYTERQREAIDRVVEAFRAIDRAMSAPAVDEEEKR